MREGVNEGGRRELEGVRDEGSEGRREAEGVRDGGSEGVRKGGGSQKA